MKTKKDTERYFRTSSFPIVIFLYAKNQQIAGINPTDDGNRKEFAFVKTDYLEELVDLYKFGERNDPGLLIEAHLYEQARRELLDALKGR
jgi:hypothetical protein